jgi:hypothetical protein
MYPTMNKITEMHHNANLVHAQITWLPNKDN